MTRYGHLHRLIRAALVPQAYGRPCIHCGRVMLPGQPLALDHTADGSGYRGIVHLRCNAQEGGRRGAARKRRRSSVIFP